MLRCAILDDYQGVALAATDWSPLAGKVETVVFRDHIEDRDRLVDRLAAFDIVIAMRERTPFDRALIERLPRLKLIVTTGMRNASIDVAAAAEHGIPVAGTGAEPWAAAELAFGLILALMRQIPREARNLRAGGPWQLGLGRDLAGARLGVIGLGKLGQRVAVAGHAFGMKVSGWSRSLTPEKAEALGVDFCASIDEVLKAADVVSIHLTLNADTRGLIGAREIALMKPTAYLVNTARGPIVDEAALIGALEAGRIAGAGLDVFDREPLPPDHPFRRLDNVVATPHLGYVTEGTYRIYFRDAVEDILAWMDGRPVRLIEPKKP